MNRAKSIAQSLDFCLARGVPLQTALERRLYTMFDSVLPAVAIENSKQLAQ